MESFQIWLYQREMNSQVYYIIVAMMLASATLSAIFFIAWKTMGRREYALSWSVAFLAAACQWFFNLQSNWFPSPETYWLTVNAFALVLITVGIRGHCQRTKCDYLPNNLWPYAGLVYFAIFWTTVVDPHIGIRTALVPAAACVTLFLSALMIIRHRETSRPAEWAAATSMVLFGVTQGVAAGMAAMQGAGGDSAYQALYLNFNFLTLPAGYMATGMFVIFMLASDISIDMKEVAIRDQLTGVLNRRGLGEQGAQAYANARRTGRPVSVVMTDIDRFKNINDDFGHASGDDALVHFSKLLIEGRRSEDILARVGGEEFALILPGTPLERALEIADRLRAKIEADEMTINGIAVKMTSSFGVAAISTRDTCLSDTIIRADRALYRSKRAGRNQVDLDSSQMMISEDGTLKRIAG
jgi:diguanylate cyclase (GGDEF)-like protein